MSRRATYMICPRMPRLGEQEWLVDEYLVARHLGGGERADEEAVGDLDVGDRDTSFHFRQRSHVVDVAALDGDDLALADPPAREESFALYGTLADAGLRRQIGRGHREPSASAGRRAEHKGSVIVHH